MKKALLLLLCGLATVTLYGQGFAIAAPALINTAYEGVDNSFTVALENCNCKLLSLSTDFGTITPGMEPCQFILKTDKPGIAHFSLKKKEKGSWTEVGTMTCTVKEMPVPAARIAGRNGGLLPVTVFKVQRGIIAGPECSEAGGPYSLKSFRLEVLRNGAAISSMTNKGNLFEPKVTEFFQTLKPGDKILFNDILCIYPWGRTVLLQPFDLTIQ